MFGLWKITTVKSITILGDAPNAVETLGVFADMSTLNVAVLRNKGYEFIGFARTSSEVSGTFNAIGITSVRYMEEPTITFEEVSL